MRWRSLIVALQLQWYRIACAKLTGIPAARSVAGMVAEPARLTSRQMDAWAKGFTSSDVCDQVYGSAFLASPLAWRKVAAWAAHKDEFVRRAAFALLATMAVHDKQAGNNRFIAALPARKFSCSRSG